MFLLRRYLGYFIFGCTMLTPWNFALAKLFSNSYVSFELPDNWNCKLEVTEYVCTSQYAKQAKEAIIILAAKEAGPTDSLTLFKAHLETPKSVPDKTGKMVPSQKKHVKEMMINSHPWIDSLHLGSEINSYYTRYLATVKERLAILVTFSAHKEHYTKYSGDFLKAVQSLKVIATRDVQPPIGGPITHPTGPREHFGVDPVQPIIQPIPLPNEDSAPGIMEKLLALLLLVGAIGYYIWKKRKG